MKKTVFFDESAPLIYDPSTEKKRFVLLVLARLRTLVFVMLIEKYASSDHFSRFPAEQTWAKVEDDKNMIFQKP
jgi:hypothetical protein